MKEEINNNQFNNNEVIYNNEKIEKGKIIKIASMVKDKDKTITRIVYTRNDVIIFEEILKIEDKYIRQDKKIKNTYEIIEYFISKRMYMLGADKFYIVKFDIESNSINKKDINVIKNVYLLIRGFKKFIIINNDSYIEIENVNGSLVSNIKKKLIGYDEKVINNKIIKYPRYNIKIEVPSDLIRVMNYINKQDRYCILEILDKDNNLILMQDISIYLIKVECKEKKKELEKLVRIYKDVFKKSKVIILINSEAVFYECKKFVDNNVLEMCVSLFMVRNKIITHHVYVRNNEKILKEGDK